VKVVSPEQLKQLIQENLACQHIEVSGDGRHFEATIVSDLFEGKLPVKRQQLVYAALGDKIADGEVHAFSMKTYTPSQWEQQNG
jgi:acid stress-induced BolA-like protein IbaG/YrbA